MKINFEARRAAWTQARRAGINFLASGKWSEAEDFPQIVHAF